MTHVVLSVSKALLLTVSFYGWGSLINKWLGNDRPSWWAYQSTLGIGGLIAIGGALNAMGLAGSTVLLFLLLTGLGLTVFFVSRRLRETWKNSQVTDNRPAGSGRNRTLNLVYFGLILLVFVFLAAVLMPARTFNLHDDFHAYLMWPIRMLQTGTLGGNPFDHLGVSSLGGQSFLQGIYLTFGKIADINVFDSIVCLILILGLLKEMGDFFGINPIFVILAALLTIFINPQYVNISSLYSGSLMLLGLTFATILFLDSYKGKSAAGLVFGAVPAALFYAALLTLKTTYIFAALTFWAGSFFFSLLLAEERGKILTAYLSCVVITIFLVLPWGALYWSRYLHKIHYILNDIGYAQSATTHPPVPADEATSLFSNTEMFYGNTYLDYLGLVVMLLFAAATAGWLVWKNRNRREFLLLIPFTAVFLSAAANYYLIRFIADPPRMVVRYSCPILIAAAPASVLLAGWYWKHRKLKLQTGPAPRTFFQLTALALIIFQAGFLWVYRGTFTKRTERAYNHRTLLSFPLAEDNTYKEYNDYVLGGRAGKRIAQIQGLLPPGKAVFAWTAAPFLFDFARNPIYPINEAGLVYNLEVMPFAKGVEAMRRYFLQYGIQYIIWEYNGYGMKKPNRMGSMQNDLIRALQGLMPGDNVLYNDGNIIVFSITGQRGSHT